MSKGVLVLEGAKEAGKKILMSGGSRCNVLPAAIDVGRDYFTAQTATRGGRRAAATSHKALQRIFSTWSVEECRQWMEEEVGLELAMEEDTSKWFPRSNSAREVRDRLVAFALDKGVDLQYNQRITRLQRESSSGMWYCESEGGEQYRAPRVVVAMGGKSFPAVGTDGKGYQLAQELGHTIRPVYPALTPLTGPHPGGNQLAGVSLNVGVTAEAGPSGQLRTDAHRTGATVGHRSSTSRTTR